MIILRDPKLYVSAVVVALTSLLASGVLPAPWDAVATAVLAGLATLVGVAPQGAGRAQDDAS